MEAKKSSFQLKNQRLLKVKYEINSVFDFNKIQLDIDYNLKIKKNIENKTANVLMNFKVFNKENLEEIPFYFDLDIEGDFNWEMDIVEDSFLEINAPAVLMAYIRPIISQLTSFSGYPPLILPLINFQKK